MRFDRCVQCGRPAGGETVAVVGGVVHKRCVVPPPPTAWRTALPPADRDMRLQRAQRLAPYVPGETPFGTWVRGWARPRATPKR